MTAQTAFAERLLAWWALHGRHDLPWQHPRDAYRVWLSEIMLQQTRVETVLGYFERFLGAFPDLRALADAELDQVLALWSGLGYYARARNLHAAARRIRDTFNGDFPRDPETLASLPGIGRSTAAAIVAQAFDRRAVILDGNVKRLLARHAAIEGWPGRPAVEKRLWAEADARTPADRAADYTQAIMDLGSMICRARAPGCPLCPVADDCRARRRGRERELPHPRPARKLPERATEFLILRDASGRVLLQRRAPAGIWGGLWCFPERGDSALPPAVALPAPAALRHVFTHFALTMTFQHARASDPERLADDAAAWFAPERALELGLPQPVRRVLGDLVAESEDSESIV